MTNPNTMPKAIGANYAVWGENTTITLCNVLWDNQYKNIVRFNNKKALNDYLESTLYKHTNIGNASYVKVDEPIRLPLPIDEVMNYNYIRVHNPAQKPVDGAEQYYYYFIIGVEFASPGTTRVQVQLDVWQTFGDKAKFGSAFVEQGHIGIANSKQFDDYGRKYLTVPEGLNTGADMVTARATNYPVIQAASASVAMVCSANLRTDPEEADGKPQLQVGASNYVQGVVSGIPTYYFKSIADFNLFTLNYGKYPWIMNAIKSITLIPNAFSNNEKYREVKLDKANVTVYENINNVEKGRGIYDTIQPKFRDFLATAIPQRYRGLKKFLTYPYCAIELTMFQGSNTVLKPENIPMEDAQIAIKSSNVTPGQKLMAYIRSYNARSAGLEVYRDNGDGTRDYMYDQGDYLENAIVMDNFPTLALSGDAGNLSLAQNFNGIAQQRKTADWSQQKSLQGNQTSYDNSNASISNMDTQAQIGRWSTQRNNDVANNRQAAGMGIGAAAALGTGMGPAGAVGAAASAGNGMLDILARGQNTDTALAASRASSSSNIGTASYINDSNKALSDWAARGDYATAIAAINAKVEDTALTPPFSVGAAGGETFLLTQGSGVQVYFIMKTIAAGAMMQIGEYWLRYGYLVNSYVRNIPADLMCMSNFTYWRFTETVLTMSMVPEWVKMVIRGIFEKGTTVWLDPTKIGVIDIANNVPKNGISY